MQTERFQYCLDQLRRFDHDRYLAVLLTPAPVRAPLCALYSFEVEMSRIPYTVSEPMLADIRFQWWRETLEALAPGPGAGHEIAGALAETLYETPIVPADLVALIDAHARDLSEKPLRTLTELEEHVLKTAGLATDFALRIAGGAPVGEDLKTGIGAATIAYGLVNQVRRLPADAASQRLGLPLELMERYEIDPHDLFAGIVRPGLGLALGEILDRAEALFEGARPLSLRESPGVGPVLLPAGLTPLYLKALRRPDFDPFRHSSEIPAYRRQFRYLRLRWRQQI